MPNTPAEGSTPEAKKFDRVAFEEELREAALEDAQVYYPREPRSVRNEKEYAAFPERSQKFLDATVKAMREFPDEAANIVSAFDAFIFRSLPTPKSDAALDAVLDHESRISLARIVFFRKLCVTMAQKPTTAPIMPTATTADTVRTDTSAKVKEFREGRHE